MLCSRCSEKVKPIVAVDIDGTLGDYHDHFLRFADDYLGWRSQHGDSRFSGSEHFRDYCCQAYGIELSVFRDIKLAYRQGGMKRSMPLYSGAARLCEGVRAEGADLWLTTTRPYLRLDNIDPDTREWLRRHEIVFDGLLYDEAKYERLAEIVDRERVVAVVDDLAEMVEAANAMFEGKAIQRMTVWNGCATSAELLVRPMGDLGAIEVEIIHRIQQWKEQHE